MPTRFPPPTTLGMRPGAADARAHIITKSGRLLVSPNRNLCFRLAPPSPQHIIFARTLPQVPAGLAPPISIAFSLSLSLSLRRPAVNASPLCSRVLLSHPFSPMSLMALREQLNMLVNSMYIEGLLDQQFQQLQMLQDASSPGFVAEVITLFCEDAERILTELTKLVDQAVVEFQKVDAYVHQLKGSSSSVGAQNVKLACIQFRQFCEENNKDGCLNALNVVKHHYYLLRNKFDTMLQLEQRIQAYDSKQQN